MKDESHSEKGSATSKMIVVDDFGQACPAPEVIEHNGKKYVSIDSVERVLGHPNMQFQLGKLMLYAVGILSRTGLTERDLEHLKQIEPDTQRLAPNLSGLIRCIAKTVNGVLSEQIPPPPAMKQLTPLNAQAAVRMNVPWENMADEINAVVTPTFHAKKGDMEAALKDGSVGAMKGLVKGMMKEVLEDIKKHAASDCDCERCTMAREVLKHMRKLGLVDENNNPIPDGEEGTTHTPASPKVEPFVMRKRDAAPPGFGNN